MATTPKDKTKQPTAPELPAGAPSSILPSPNRDTIAGVEQMARETANLLRENIARYTIAALLALSEPGASVETVHSFYRELLRGLANDAVLQCCHALREHVSGFAPFLDYGAAGSNQY